jgi:hypothetical protein
VVELDPATGEPKKGAKPFEVQNCSRHSNHWKRHERYRVLAEVMRPAQD